MSLILSFFKKIYRFFIQIMEYAGDKLHTFFLDFLMNIDVEYLIVIISGYILSHHYYGIVIL